jgi:small subunit ribosomal protein S1
MSYTRRVRTPGEVLSEGDTVKLKVLSVDPKRKRISLSLKQVEDDPWTGASVRWPAESVVEGRVKRVTDFGAFVELSPGVEGLVHISELSHEFVRSPQEAVQEGQTIQAKVLSVDEESRRISLSIKQATEAPAQPSSLPPRRPENKRKRPLKGGLD